MTINLSIAIRDVVITLSNLFFRNRKNVNKTFLGPAVFTASQLNNKSQDENCDHPHCNFIQKYKALMSTLFSCR